ncbi:MAG: hypothetical protein Q4G09_02390 [Clostridia bacterium]|nr:hypothetical protein [Clostridia bacterium]
MEKNHGITLVVLVITIIVMLILVGVGITVAINGGLIGTAQDATIKSKQKEAEKRIETLLTYYNAQEYIGETGSLKEYLIEKLGAGEVTDNRDGTYTIEIEGSQIIVKEDGSISIPVSRPGLQIGDYVNYTPTAPSNTALEELNTEVNAYSGYTSATQDLSQSTYTGLKWQILNIHPDGTIDLVSTPTTGTVYFGGAQGYNNGVYLMHDICKVLYSNSTLGVEARSINLNDIEYHMTPAGITARNGYKRTIGEKDVKYGDTYTYEGNYSYYPNLYAQENKSGINIDKEPEETIKERLKADGIDDGNPAQIDTNTGSNARGQANTKGLTVTQTYYASVSFNSTNYDAKAASVLQTSNRYWVASRYVLCNSPYASFGLRYADSYVNGYYVFYSNSYSRTYDYRLRAVVSLGSNIQIETCTGTNGVNNPHTISSLGA